MKEIFYEDKRKKIYIKYSIYIFINEICIYLDFIIYIYTYDIK